MNYIVQDMLMHEGVSVLNGAPGVGSGRWPLGSGENPYQHVYTFLSRINDLKRKGLSETEIAKLEGLSTGDFRLAKSLANNYERMEQVARARQLRDKGYSLTRIASEMGFKNDSSVRNLLNFDSEERMKSLQNTVDFLKKQVDEKGMIEVGPGVERRLGISELKLKEALYLLENAEGYGLYRGRVQNATNKDQQTTYTVLAKPGIEYKDAYNLENIGFITDYISDNNGQSFRKKFEYPESMDSSRLQVKYAEDGGDKKDGVIEIRRGVDDLSLGNSNYAQVRILVDGTHYIKGMAVYSDDLPEGVDVLFNTSKSKSIPVMGPKNNTVLKPIESDPNNPFGALIKEEGGQSYYISKDGKYTDPVTGEKMALSLINKRAEEGDWSDWSDKLPSQFLSKQPKALIDRQLYLTEADKRAEFEEIASLTNPTVKKHLLQSFADDCDTAAVHLQAAALPRQKYKVILPVDIKENEVYAPGYENGEQVVLIRYPHGGRFEIPRLTVNNKNASGEKILGKTPADAIGINPEVAKVLSGADFDGDTVMVIPVNSRVKIENKPPLQELKSFDPHVQYAEVKGMNYIKTSAQEQNEMGRISNLITDMTLIGATDSELARAVKHSMVVIDARKHRLNYKQSELDNDIKGLKKKYQQKPNGKFGGASTLISRAKSQQRVDKREGSPRVNEDGSLSWKTASDSKLYMRNKDGSIKTDKGGAPIKRKQVSTQMAETRDARDLISLYKTQPEIAYANFANSMKSLANEARKLMISTPRLKYSASARQSYAKEVESLMTKLNVARENTDKERHAQIMASSVVKAKKRAYEDSTGERMSAKEEGKIRQQALTSARSRTGARRHPIDVTSSEWEAIQAGAISENVLKQILQKTDIDRIREYATPRSNKGFSEAKIATMRALKDSGYTLKEIANRFGVSETTISSYLRKENN